MLAAGIIMSHCHTGWFTGTAWVEWAWYIVAFLPVGLPVVKEAVEGMAHDDIFNEFTLMSIACIGAFAIHELPEAVGVMLFYSVGEKLQDLAVTRATGNISHLLDVRGKKATVIRDGIPVVIEPEKVNIGDIIEVKPGERVPLDGILLDSQAAFDTSALTGESIPRDITKGKEVLAGMISSSAAVRIKVTKAFSDSTLAHILDMVKNAASRKAHTELFITRFSRIYTPVVILLAVMLSLVPWLVSLANPSFHYIFSEWLYRSLVFLVISCPCALVISVPLSYFAGIGAASRKGILFKGGNYLEAVTRINSVAFDKTGTLTTGKFSVKSVVPESISNDELITLTAAAEAGSTHPLARALMEYVKGLDLAVPAAAEMSEKAGFGTSAKVDGHTVLAGNLKLLRDNNIAYPADLDRFAGTIIACAVDGRYAGYIELADTIKPDSAAAIRELLDMGIDDVTMLSGDKNEIVESYARQLGISKAYGGLLPQDKAAFIEKKASTPGKKIAFVGDGMNDAPVLALSNVGVAMGGLGSDAAIESADVVIQNDEPSRLVTAIRIGRTTHAIAMENIIGAIAVKVVILILGAFGIASLWAAVFADVGVALICVLNAMRILWKNY